MIRLKDIAAAAGVSVMTVSKALRDGPDVSPTMKTRIKLLAQQMGYVPDSSAQGLRNRTTKLFGLVISSLTSPIFSPIVVAIEERAYEMGYDVLLAQTLDIPEREEACIRRFLSRRVQGLFISPAYRMGTEARIYQELQTRRVPTILLGHTAPFCNQFINVETDDLLASYNATQHLLKLGHKRIAFFTGPQATPWTQERFEGYRRALREAGLDADEKLVFEAGRTIEDGAKTALQMINESSDATAVQAVNDLVGVGCADALLKQGLKIPEDISIVGFGNILLSEYFKVPLTTLDQPKLRLGTAAVETMQQLLLGKRAESKRLPAELVVRARTRHPICYISVEAFENERRNDNMKKALTGILILVGVCGVLWVAKGWTLRHSDQKTTKFNADAENLILGLQQYKEFTGSYPTGNNIQIAKALLGQSEKKVLILAVRRASINDKGEILDPWGTPLQFYFSHNEVMIRSAGPNKAWEDSSVSMADDLYRCAGTDKK